MHYYLKRRCQLQLQVTLIKEPEVSPHSSLQDQHHHHHRHLRDPSRGGDGGGHCGGCVCAEESLVLMGSPVSEKNIRFRGSESESLVGGKRTILCYHYGDDGGGKRS